MTCHVRAINALTNGHVTSAFEIKVIHKATHNSILMCNIISSGNLKEILSVQLCAVESDRYGCKTWPHDLTLCLSKV